MVFVMYGTTAGYDLGTTMILPFIKDPVDQRVALNASGFTWDGNQSWIVFAGGGLFVIWPVVYATALSYFYLPMLAIIVGFFLRPTGYDYRGKSVIQNGNGSGTGDFHQCCAPRILFGFMLGRLNWHSISFEPMTERVFFDATVRPTAFHCSVASSVTMMMHGTLSLPTRSPTQCAR